jgi:hypothetical protein
MFVELLIAQLQPETIDRACQVYREEMLPPLKETDGYDASFLLTDLDVGKAVLMIIWDCEADVTAQRTNGNLQHRIAQLSDVLAAPVLTEVYELTSADALAELPNIGCLGVTDSAAG